MNTVNCTINMDKGFDIKYRCAAYIQTVYHRELSWQSFSILKIKPDADFWIQLDFVLDATCFASTIMVQIVFMVMEQLWPDGMLSAPLSIFPAVQSTDSCFMSVTLARICRWYSIAVKTDVNSSHMGDYYPSMQIEEGGKNILYICNTNQNVEIDINSL